MQCFSIQFFELFHKLEGCPKLKLDLEVVDFFFFFAYVVVILSYCQFSVILRLFICWLTVFLLLLHILIFNILLYGCSNSATAWYQVEDETGGGLEHAL